MIKTFKPQSKILKNYVDTFYVFTQNESKNINYIAFPHINTGLSFFRNTSIKRNKQGITIHATPSKKEVFTVEILGKYLNPLFVNYAGKIQEIAIVFRPLGMNHFFREPLYKITPAYSQDLKNKIWLKYASALFKESSLEAQIQSLEKFLLQQLQVISMSEMYTAIDYLAVIEKEYSIQKIASLLHMNLKTFQRHFYKHLSCTPSDYRRIAKFRHSLTAGLMEKEIKKLTAIAHNSYYYDQSYFVREYKKLTSLPPKAFFSAISSFDNNNIVWKIK